MMNLNPADYMWTFYKDGHLDKNKLKKYIYEYRRHGPALPAFLGNICNKQG